MTREELQRLYGECVSRAFRAEQLAGLVRGVESFLAEPDPTVEIAYLRAKLADVEAERDQLINAEVPDDMLVPFEDEGSSSHFGRRESWSAERAIQRVRDLAKYLSGLAGGDRHYADQILRALDGGAS